MASIASTPIPAAGKSPSVMLWSLVIAGHAVLGYLMLRIPVFSTVHAAGCLAAGIVIAARRPPVQTAYVVAYIAGSEVLWRMTHADVFWEYGKYAISAVLMVALFRMRVRRNRFLALGYLGLLLPSAVLTFFAMPFDAARQLVSFNISGPLCLALCVLFFSNVRLAGEDIRNTFFFTIAPVFAIATIAYVSTVTAVDLEFNRQSNSVTSGGFGPNQVSAMLGLSLLFALLMLIERRLPWRVKAPLLGLAVLFATQAALTFSRGGLALAFGGAFMAIVYLVRDRRTRVTLVILATLLFAVGKYVVVPRLDEFTSGRLSERYMNTTSSNRFKLAMFDLEIFEENPVLGVGPGVAQSIRGEMGHLSAAHTEFTRLLAEHGILGLIALVLLFVLAVRAVLAARTLVARAFTAAMMTWFMLFLLVNAMRLSAPAFLFGLACAVAYSSIPPRRGQELTRG